MQPPTHREDRNFQGSETFSEERASGTHCLDRKNASAGFFSSLLRRSAGVLPLLCTGPAWGALPGWGWGFWGQSLGRRKGCWKSRMTLNKDTLATKKVGQVTEKEESLQKSFREKSNGIRKAKSLRVVKPTTGIMEPKWPQEWGSGLGGISAFSFIVLVRSTLCKSQLPKP